MILFTSTRLTKAVNSYHSQLKKISRDLVPALGEGAAERFVAAADAYNEAELNRLVEAAMQTYLNESNIIYGLELYCQKFGIAENFSSMDTEKIILYIDQHKREISQILESKGV